MNLRSVSFGVIALGIIIAGIALKNLAVGLSVFIPVFYGVSRDVGTPYSDGIETWAGVVSIISYLLLVASVAVETPTSTLFEVAWYGYIGTSTFYAMLMSSAPDLLDDGWANRVHLALALFTLLAAVAFSAAVAARMTTEETDTVAYALAIAGAAASVCLDCWVTVGWFWRGRAAGRDTRVMSGRVHGFAFVVAVVGLFTTRLPTAIVGLGAGVIMILREAMAPVDEHLRCASILVRGALVVLGIASVWLPHVYGLSATGGEAVIALLTMWWLSRAPGIRIGADRSVLVQP